MRIPLLLAFLWPAAAQPPALPELALASYPSAAREVLSRAHAEALKHPTSADAAGTLGRWLHAWEQWESAHQAYARAQALAPRTFDWHYLDAVVLQRLVRHRDAAARLQQALSLNPDYLPARVKLAEALLETGDAGASKPLFDKLLNESAAAPAAHLGLGRIAALEGHHELAITHFERAVTLFAEFGAAYYALARSYRAVGRPDDAERALQQHAEYGPRWPGIEDPLLAAVTGLRDDPRAMLAKGIATAEAGDVRGAIALHEEVLQRDSSLVQAHVNLLSLYGRVGDWKKAAEHYEAAVAAGIATADLYYDYGVVQALQENWAAAEEAYRRAIAVNPLHANALNNLGQLLERRRQFAEAASQYRKAVEAQPSFRLGRFNFGRMLLVLGQPERAIVEFEQLQHPRDAETPRYAFALATALVRTGRKEEGIRIATEARRLAIDFGQAELAAAIARDLANLK